jgi:hypothetical protein
VDSISIVTETVPSTTDDLTTLLDVLADLGLNNTDEATKAYLRQSITRCSQAAAAYCNRSFISATVSEAFYSAAAAFKLQITNDFSLLQLARFPLVSVTSVVEGTGAGATTLVQDTDFKVIPLYGQLMRLSASSGLSIRWSQLPVTVVYVAGFAPTAVPDDLNYAVIQMVKARYMARSRDPAIRNQGEPGVGNVAFWLGYPPDVQEVLDNYRDISVA